MPSSRPAPKLALVSDAGTPLVSDPGYRLVQEALEKNIHVTSVPGPSAVLGRPVGGGPADRPLLLRRVFAAQERPAPRPPRRTRQCAGTWSSSKAPARIAETLEDCLAALGERDAAVARELTKLYETVRRGALSELAAALAKEEPRGEIVLLVAPPEPGSAAAAEEDLDARIEAALLEHSVKDAAAVVSAATGQPKRQVYARALQISARGK